MTLRSSNGAARRPLPPALVEHQWKPGQSGNPGGIGGEYQRCMKLCREASFDAAQEIIRLSRESDDDRVRYTSAAWVYERAWGKPKEYDPAKGQAEHPKLDLSRLSRAERDLMGMILRKAMALPADAASAADAQGRPIAIETIPLEADET